MLGVDDEEVAVLRGDVESLATQAAPAMDATEEALDGKRLGDAMAGMVADRVGVVDRCSKLEAAVAGSARLRGDLLSVEYITELRQLTCCIA